MSMTTAARTPSAGPNENDKLRAVMFTAHGVGVVDGVAIGRAVVMGTTALEVPHYYITTREIESEVARLQRSVYEVQADLEAQKFQLPTEAPSELDPLITVHTFFLYDTMLNDVLHCVNQTRR